MILHELVGRNESHPAYRGLELSNGERHYSFLQSIVLAARGVDRPFLSQTVAINFHAIACLHANAGEYRPCPVIVGEYKPPEHWRVNALMDDFVNLVNRRWSDTEPVQLAAYVLWRLNHIHPFINGNGRTARAACYFVLCLKVEGWLGGYKILPERIPAHRDKYIQALKEGDQEGNADDPALTSLCDLIVRLLSEQISELW